MQSSRNLLIFVLTTALFPAAMAGLQEPASHYDPAPNRRQTHDDFVSSNLKRINPANTDYGQEIENERAVLFAETIDNLLFWSNVCAMALLIGAFMTIFHQHRERQHRQIIAARFLAWYHNQLLDARDRAMEEIGKFERFRRAVEATQIAASNGDISATTTKNSRSAADDTLTTENNSLRQKMSLMEKTETALRKENSELKRLLRERPEKNTAVKLAAPSIPAARKEGDNGKG